MTALLVSLLIAIGWLARMAWEYGAKPDWRWSEDRAALEELGREWRGR